MQPSKHVSSCNKPVQAKSTCKHAGQKKTSHLPNSIKKCPGIFCKNISHFIMVCRLIIVVEQQPSFLFPETHNAHNHRGHTAYTHAVECGKSSTLKKPECLKMVCHTHNVTIFIEVHWNCLSSVKKMSHLWLAGGRKNNCGSTIQGMWGGDCLLEGLLPQLGLG